MSVLSKANFVWWSDWWSSILNAKPLLGVMMSCMFGGSTSFTSKKLHVLKLNSPFLYKEIRFTIDAINRSLVGKKLLFAMAIETSKLFKSCLIPNNHNNG